jgi:O-antigen/teichoic acid export membrane protein
VAAAAVASGLVVHADRPELQLAIAVVACGLVFSSVASCATPVFQTRVRFGAVALADLLSRGLSLVATITVAAVDAGLIAMAAVQVIPPLVRMLVTFIAANRMERLRPRFDRRETFSLVRESLPLTAIAVVAVLYWRADGLLLSVLSEPLEVGAYGLALAIAGNLSVVSQVFAQTALSTLAERRATDPAAFDRTVRRSLQLMLVLLLPVAVLGPPIAGDVIALISSPEFAERGTLVLQLFLVAVAIGFLNPLLSTALFSAGRQRYLMRMALVTLTINIGLNLALIPALGAVGCGIALIASEVAGVTVSTAVLRREGVRLPTLLDLARILPALAAGLGVELLLRDVHFLLAGAAGGLVYIGAVLVTGALPVAVVKSVLGRRRTPAESSPR